MSRRKQSRPIRVLEDSEDGGIQEPTLPNGESLAFVMSREKAKFVSFFYVVSTLVTLYLLTIEGAYTAHKILPSLE